jgi:hypothetical protein
VGGLGSWDGLFLFNGIGILAVQFFLTKVKRRVISGLDPTSAAREISRAASITFYEIRFFFLAISFYVFGNEGSI